MKKGFVLIELLISISISSIVMVVFITAFIQIQRTAEALEKTMSVDTKAALFQAILENDFSGAFTPSVQSLSFSDNEKDIVEEKVEKVFYESREQEEVTELSFITCNPLNPSIDFKPRIARIFYYFKDNFDERGSKIFYRQQSLNKIDYDFAREDSYKYEVLDGIKNIKMEYVFEKPQDENDSEEEDQKKEVQEEGPEKIDSVKKKYIVLDELDDEKESAGKIPSYITVTLQLWKDAKHVNWSEYTFKFHLVSAHYLMPKVSMPKPKKDASQQQAPQQPGQPPAQAAGPIGSVGSQPQVNVGAARTNPPNMPPGFPSHLMPQNNMGPKL